MTTTTRPTHPSDLARQNLRMAASIDAAAKLITASADAVDAALDRLERSLTAADHRRAQQMARLGDILADALERFAADEQALAADLDDGAFAVATIAAPAALEAARHAEANGHADRFAGALDRRLDEITADARRADGHDDSGHYPGPAREDDFTPTPESLPEPAATVAEEAKERMDAEPVLVPYRCDSCGHTTMAPAESLQWCPDCRTDSYGLRVRICPIDPNSYHPQTCDCETCQRDPRTTPAQPSPAKPKKKGGKRKPKQ